MSTTFTLTGRSSTLSTYIEPPIVLDPNKQYGLALLGFYSYNNIPNIEKGTKFYYTDINNATEHSFEIPVGSYDISDLEYYIQEQLPQSKEKDPNVRSLSLVANDTTQRCELYSDLYNISFEKKDSLRKLLGFPPKIFEAKKLHVSNSNIEIINVRTIHIDCNLTTGSYYNGNPTHTLYEFALLVDPGFAIDEIPQNLIYKPIAKKEINNVTLNILDQDFQPINFRGEEIVIVLELKPLWY